MKIRPVRVSALVLAVRAPLRGGVQDPRILRDRSGSLSVYQIHLWFCMFKENYEEHVT